MYIANKHGSIVKRYLNNFEMKVPGTTLYEFHGLISKTVTSSSSTRLNYDLHTFHVNGLSAYYDNYCYLWSINFVMNTPLA